MTPPLSKSEFRTCAKCDEIHETEGNTSKWIAGIMIVVFLSFAGIWSRSAAINSSAETFQEVAIGRLEKEVETTSSRQERMDKKLDKILDLLISGKP